MRIALFTAIVSLGTLAGCNDSPPPKGGIDITVPGVEVNVDKQGVDVKTPGTEVKANQDGVDVKAPGADVKVDP